jgi:transketolase
MALAEKVLAAHFNRDGHDVVDHWTYVFLGDGCLMEGISHEACSLAGTLGLGKLVCFYDDNGISIDGHVEGWFTDDTPKRFEAYGWHVLRDVDGHDSDAVKRAITEARAVSDKPTMICCKTIIGWGAPNLAGSHESHGAALGDAEIAATRAKINWPHEPFVVPKDIYAGWDAKTKGDKAEAGWNKKFAAYRSAHPDLAAEFERRMSGKLPTDWAEKSAAFITAVNQKAEKVATRKASQNTLNGFGPLVPELLGGSADLAGSNLTLWSGSKGVSSSDADGNYLYYGVREFGMAAIMNGLALHAGFIPYGGTFLVFSDYARNAVRMAAITRARNIFVFTHDSIGLGEDGPTHQPIEHVASLRIIPNMTLWRPCDAVETAIAWKAAIENEQGPSCLILTRQAVPHQVRNQQQLGDIARGGYVLVDWPGKPDAILIATGSEVGLAVDAAKQLSSKGTRVRVVSMPSVEVFARQDAAYRDAVLPPEVTARVAVEAGVPDGWWKYVGTRGQVIGMTTFGESAPAGDLFKHFGFTVDNVVKAVRDVLS